MQKKPNILTGARERPKQSPRLWKVNRWHAVCAYFRSCYLQRRHYVLLNGGLYKITLRRQSIVLFVNVKNPTPHGK